MLVKFNFSFRFIFFAILLLGISSPVIYYGLLNWIGPSTEYLEPILPTSVPGPNGIPIVYLGDEFYVQHIIIRHKLNGNCVLHITRWAEDIDGPTPGRRHLLDYVDLQFLGANEVLHPRWPPDKIVLGYGIDLNKNPNKEDPLLPAGIDELTMDFFIIGRYDCNFLDKIFPRYVDGGKYPNESPHVRALVKRNKP